MNQIKSIPRLIESIKPKFQKPLVNFERKLMEQFCKEHKLLSYPTTAPRNVAHIGGERSYMLLGSLAKLERALMNWTMNELVSKYNFTPVVVPNIIHDNIIERCGFPTKTTRSQVYKISGNNRDSILDEGDISRLDNDNIAHSCIAGTSEFALVSLHIGDVIPNDELPKRYCALSRCYRAETSNTAAEWGLYRVHYFNKVEMVALAMPDNSEQLHEEFLRIQRELFKQLGLEFRILDMPPDDLGLSASKKYDIEAWMPARGRFGEISSTSNCRDYQSSRLNIKYSQMVTDGDELKTDSDFIHSINGTACSSIRTLIALIEQHQTQDGLVDIPPPLIPFMDGIERIPTDLDKELTAELNLYPEVER